MTKTVDFIFDFASPNAYFAYKVLPGIIERTSAGINYIPCLLGGIFKATGNQSPMTAFGRVKGKLNYERIEMLRFIKKHGLTSFKTNSAFPVNSLIMMRGAIVAEQEGRLMEYIDAGMRCMWEDNKSMGKEDIFVEAMTSYGFDGKHLLESTQQPDIKAKLIANTNSAVDRGVFGVPTFFIGDEMFFGKERLEQVEAELLV